MIFEVDTERKLVVFKSTCKVQDLYDIIVEYQLQDFEIAFERTGFQTFNPITSPWEVTPIKRDLTSPFYYDGTSTTGTVNCRSFYTTGDSPKNGEK